MVNFSLLCPAVLARPWRTLLTGLWLALLPLLALAQAPTLTAVSPLTGGPSTLLTLTGTNLTGTTRIVFVGGAGAKVVTSGFVVNAAGTSITGVLVPAGAQSGLVQTTTASGISTGGTALFTRAETLDAGGTHTVAVRTNGTLWA